MREGRQHALPVEVRKVQNQARALALRISGRTYRNIASAMGLKSHRYVQTLCMDALSDLKNEVVANADELRALEVARLDAMQLALWHDRAEPAVANTLLSIIKRRCDLLGLDLPVRMEQPQAAAFLGAIDMDKLSVGELRSLYAILEKASAPEPAAVPALNPADEVQPPPDAPAAT